jgi:hypothetical protein
MPHKAPPIPPAQRARLGEKPHIEGPDAERRDEATGLPSHQPGDADVNLKSQGRYGNRRQNVDTVYYKHQAR